MHQFSSLLFWPHHVDDKGVVSSVEASDGYASGKKNGQDEIEVWNEGDKETKSPRHKETGTKEGKFLPRNPRVVTERE